MIPTSVMIFAIVISPINSTGNSDEEADQIRFERRMCGRNATCLFAKLSNQSAVNSDQIDRLLPVNEKGSTMGDMVEVLREQGIACHASRSTFDQLKHLPMPVIALIHAKGAENQTHFIVIVSTDSQTVTAIDGTDLTYVKYTRDELNDRWKGHLIHQPLPFLSRRWFFSATAFALGITAMLLFQRISLRRKQ